APDPSTTFQKSASQASVRNAAARQKQDGQSLQAAQQAAGPAPGPGGTSNPAPAPQQQQGKQRKGVAPPIDLNKTLGQVLGGNVPDPNQATGNVLGGAGQSVNPQTASDLLDYLLGQ